MKVIVKGNKVNKEINTNWAVGFDQSNCCCYDDKC